mgnify:CR=1 FL=1
MRILDASAGLELADRARLARRFWPRLRGLMFVRNFEPGEGLVIVPCSSIHMLFMSFPIDAVFFDREGRVTHVARRVRPWLGLAWGRRGAWGVVELPAGAAAGVDSGHQLRFEPPLT